VTLGVQTASTASSCTGGCRYANPDIDEASLPQPVDFDPNTKFKDFGGDLRRFAWRQMVCDASIFDTNVPALRAREAVLATGSTPFAARMRDCIVARGDEQVRPSAYNLHLWLEVLAEDVNEPASCDVYFVISRGYEVLPRGTVHPRQVTRNYQSAFDNADEMDVEIARLLKAGFIKPYDVAAREAGYPDVQPVCTLACGMVIKITEAGIKLRLVCDGSAPHDGTSLNDTMEVPPCRLSSVDKAAATVGKNSWVFTIDEADAYMQTACSAWSVRYLCIVWRGIRYGFTVMNFGLSSACAQQQQIAIALHRAVRRRLVRAGLHCNATTSFDGHQVCLPPLYEQRQKKARLATKVFTNANRHLLRGHAVLKHSASCYKIYDSDSVDIAAASPPPTASSCAAARRQADRLLAAERSASRRIDTVSGLQQYLDDLFHACSSRRAAFFCLLVALHLFVQLRVRANMKPGKTTSPAQSYKFLGVAGCTRRFILFLDKERVESTLTAISATVSAGGCTVGELASLIGLLVFCSAVVEARPYYRSLLNILKLHCYDDLGRWSRAKKHSFIKLSATELRDLRAWHVVLRYHNGTDVARGLRRLLAPFALYSDASGTGLAFQYGGHHEVEDLPPSWAPFIFAKKDSHVRILQAQLEAWACLLGLRYAIPRCAGAGMTLRVRSDSSVFVGQARKMSSADPAVQPVLREIMWLCAVHGVRLDFAHCPASSPKIGFVDALSRRTEPDPGGKRASVFSTELPKVTRWLRQATQMSVHKLGPVQRPDLLPFLRAERCQALNFRTTWSAQRRDELDELVIAWSRESAFSRYSDVPRH
jgi:hypothetical protein